MKISICLVQDYGIECVKSIKDPFMADSVPCQQHLKLTFANRMPILPGTRGISFRRMSPIYVFGEVHSGVCLQVFNIRSFTAEFIDNWSFSLICKEKVKNIETHYETCIFLYQLFFLFVDRLCDRVMA